MVSVRVKDKRYAGGHYSKIFHGIGWEQEIYDFVKKQKNAYLICGVGFVLRREEYIKNFEIK